MKIHVIHPDTDLRDHCNPTIAAEVGASLQVLAARKFFHLEIAVEKDAEGEEVISIYLGGKKSKTS